MTLGRFIPTALLAAVGILPSTSAATPGPAGPNESATSRFRIVWTTNPTSEATIAWQQVSGKPATVHIGPADEGRRPRAYPASVSAGKVVDFDGMKSCFARVTELSPGTRYYFCLRDETGVSPRFYFDTAPTEAETFTFVAGGDSRNFRDVRVAANQVASRLAPLFIAFTGDMINQDRPEEWHDWLDDWQHTITKDGRIIPLVPHRGNHESRIESVPSLFATPDRVYYAFSIGGNLFRYYTLNSEIPANGPQRQWLAADLEEHSKKTTHLVAGYHKPMRPHVSKKSEGTNPMHWSKLFYRHGLDLALESDSHVMKRTLPLRPDPAGDEGFSAAPGDPKATVFIGEGCWGAPLRAADDAKSWTVATESFNGVDWIEVRPEGIRVKTVRVDDSARLAPVDPDEPYANPPGLSLWKAGGNPVLEIPAD